MSRSDGLSHTEILVLLALARLGDDAYGVTIRKEIAERGGRVVSIAAVYAALDRLERRGHVEPWLSEPLPERGGRAPRHYRLRRSGVVALQGERTLLDRLWSGVELRPSTVRR